MTVTITITTQVLLEMFRGGMDTSDIAGSLGLEECDVYNLMRPCDTLRSHSRSEENRDQWRRIKATNNRIRASSGRLVRPK